MVLNLSYKEYAERILEGRMYMTVEFKLTHSLSADEIKERGNDYINESDDKYADKDDSSRLAFIQ